MGAPTVTLRPVALSWLRGTADDPADLCAHGRVEFRIGDAVLVDPERSAAVTVSAAALYLLRTLERPHTKASPVGDILFPCCGFALFDGGTPDVVIVGCPNGIDFEIGHGPAGGDVAVRADDGRTWTVPLAEWRNAVFAFADRVSEFYAAAAPRTPSAEDAPGYRRFVGEWTRRRGVAFAR